jgi:8-oxo-dGTP diphosphatase
MDDRTPDGDTATGAACAIFDGEGRVLLVRHTYGRLNWELPGGGSESGEAPEETASRELVEETGLHADIERLTGVYFEAGDDLEAMLHFVFRCRWHGGLDPTPSSPEIGDVEWWNLDDLPTPISDFTERRIRDAARDGPIRVQRITRRTWRS